MKPEEFIVKIEELIREVRQLPTDIAVLAAGEFDKNFERQGFFSDTPKWKESKRAEKYRISGNKGSTLIKNSKLRDGISYTVQGQTITFTSNMPYAAVHNEGLTINHPGGTAYFYNKKRGKAVFVPNRVAARFKNELPRTKAHEIVMPKRQFIGEHPDLDKEIEEYILNTIEKVFK